MQELTSQNSADVIDIGEVRLSKKFQKQCAHKRLTYDPADRTVQCLDCERFIDPFSAFLQIVHNLESAKKRAERILAEAAEARDKELPTIAARKVEKAWRSQTMVPACPHCHEAIFSTDGFGGAQVNKKMAIEKRKFTKNALQK